MYLDKIYTLQTGVSFKISTMALQELIANAMSRQELPELENICCITDLYPYLTVVVYEGAEDLIKRRYSWINHQIRADLIARKPILFNSFCSLFWRNLDEDDPDGDEWQQLIATDQFYAQLTGLRNKLRIAKRNLQQHKKSIPDAYFELA